MKKIAAIILKDTLVRFASPSEWLFFILLPILFTVILGSSTGSMSDTRIVLPVVDKAQTDLSAQLVAALDKSSSVRVVAEDLTKAQSAFDSRRNSAVLIIPAGFNLDAQSKNSLSLKILQQPNNMDALISALTGRGYSPEVQVNERGDMAHRGGIVDFFPLDRFDRGNRLPVPRRQPLQQFKRHCQSEHSRRRKGQTLRQ